MRVLVLALVLAAAPAAAQTPGSSSFRVYEKGDLVGTMETSVERTADGWRVRGTSRIGGSVPVTIPNLDLYYDASWGGRFMTLEMKAPDDAIVHVAVVGDATRTDIVRPREARFQSSSVSRDTIFMPDRAYGAYEAVAARLQDSLEQRRFGVTADRIGFDFPLFIVPIGETRARVDTATEERLRTSAGMIDARRYGITEFRQRPTPVTVWVSRGRLLRLDLPRQSIAVLRTDLLPK